MTAGGERPRPSRIAGVLICALLGFLFVARAVAEGRDPLVVRAVNRTNLAWSPQWPDLLSRIKRAGFDSVRLSYDPPFDTSRQTIISAIQDFGLKVLVMVPLSSSEFYSDKSAMRDGNAHLYRSNRLSRIDEARFRSAFDDLIGALTPVAGGLSGIEIGNEINWADFNGDFPLVAGPPLAHDNIYTLQELSVSADGLAIIEGFKRYASLLRASSAVMLQHGLSATPLLSAGLFNGASNWPSIAGGRYLAAADTLQILNSLGALDGVDGVGIHFYPHVGARRSASAYADARAESAKEVAICQDRDLLRDKPCWITEWNVIAEHASDPPPCAADTARADYLSQQADRLAGFMAAIAPLRKSQRLAANPYLFSFDQGNKFAVWTCSALNWRQ